MRTLLTLLAALVAAAVLLTGCASPGMLPEALPRLGATYWSTRFTGARRADTGTDAAPATPSVQADPAAATSPMATLRNVY